MNLSIKLYMPDELSKIIQNFARPLSRIDWKKGSPSCRILIRELWQKYIIYMNSFWQYGYDANTIYERAMENSDYTFTIKNNNYTMYGMDSRI
jgi:hypothetical protein